MLPLLVLEECFNIAGMIGADGDPVQKLEFWWQLVQLTAVVFEVEKELFACRYFMGWMVSLLELLMWQLLQFRVLLCFSFEWQSWQYVELADVKDGFVSVLLCIQPELWQVEFKQSGELVRVP